MSNNRNSTVIINASNTPYVYSRHITNTLNCHRSRRRTNWSNIIVYSDCLCNIRKVTTSISNSISSSNYFRTSITVTNITNMSNIRSPTVVRYTSNSTDVHSRYISYTLNINICRRCTSWSNVIIYSDCLYNIRKVSTSICYSISTRNNFRTSISVTNITNMRDIWSSAVI